MKRIAFQVSLLAVVVTCAAALPAQDKESVDTAPPLSAEVNGNGLTLLAPPYVISTAPNFAIWIQFPWEDSIRRIALGDSSYFLAEADKDDPHYAIVKQTKPSRPKKGQQTETNMLVYMASGKVISITLRSGAIEGTAYLIDYPVPKLEPAHEALPKATPSQAEIEKMERERAAKQLVEELLDELEASPKQDGAVVSGGLALRIYRIERLGEAAFVSFDVENLMSKVVDVLGPQLNLVTTGNKRRGKKNVALNIEPIPLLGASMAPEQLSPGERAVGVVRFTPPVHDSNQQVVLAVANRAMADAPAQARIE